MVNVYDLNFLEDKLGSFEKEYSQDNNLEFAEKLISGFILTYIEAENKTLLNEKKNIIKKEFKPGYTWCHDKKTNSIYVTRAYGENRLFTFNPKYTRRTDYIRGKEQILNQLDMTNFDSLFDQKQVLNKFYKDLWYVRKELAIDIRNLNEISDNESLMEAQNIIDRIIFTYFICDKGLIKSESESLTGKMLFSDLIIANDNPWEIMKDLFFEFFGIRHNDSLNVNNNKIIVPYLNGGLFRPKNINKLNEIDLKINFNWENLFELLNRYTWIVGESLPEIGEDYEGNLTPDVLGHLYEKFVITIEELDDLNLDSLTITSTGKIKKERNARKSIGAYYTPENITNFLSKNAIYSYLFKENTIKNNKFPSLEHFEKNDLKNILNNIDNLTICDPSCGSGAFILKAGEILLDLKNKIYRVLDFHHSAKRCSSLVSGFKSSTIRPAKSTFKNTFFAADL